MWGAFIQTDSPLVTEVVARSGLDWLVIDRQHGANGGPDRLFALLNAAELAGVPTIVRIPWKTDFSAAMAALDLGAQGVIVPMVDNAEEAAAIASATRYPPDGSRSFGPIATGLRRTPYVLAENNAATLVLTQIETVSGYAHVEEILAVPGVDGAYIGPQDLTITHGVWTPSPKDNPALNQMSERILTVAHEAGKIAVAHTFDAVEAVHWAAMGFDMVIAAGDAALVGAAAASTMATLRASAG